MLTPEALAALNWTADGATDPSFKLYPPTGHRYHQIDAEGLSCDTHSAMYAEPRTICDTLSRDASITDEEDAAYSALLAASPALARFAVKAREFALFVIEHSKDHGLEFYAGKFQDAAEEALEAAGVEVGDA